MILFANCVYTVIKRYNNGGCFGHIAAAIFIPSIAINSLKKSCRVTTGIPGYIIAGLISTIKPASCKIGGLPPLFS